MSISLKFVVSIGAFGLLAGAASAPPRTRTDASVEQARIADAAERIASRLEQPDGLNAECARGVEDRRSALCAQWVSADAAESSAYWAWVSAMIGVATLGAAVVAAIYAARAANAARDALGHERSLVLPRFQLTAKLKVYAGSNNDLWVSLDVVGDSPARALTFAALTYAGGMLGPREKLVLTSETASDDGQHLTLHFKPPGMLAQFCSRDQVGELVGKQLAFEASWSSRDAAGRLGRRAVALDGRFATWTSTPVTEIWADMTASTYDETA